MTVLRHRFNTAPVRNTAAWRRADPGEGGSARADNLERNRVEPRRGSTGTSAWEGRFSPRELPQALSDTAPGCEGGRCDLNNSTNMLAGASLLAQPLSVAGDSRLGRGGEGRRLRGKRERRRPTCPLCGRVNRQPGGPCARQAGPKALPVVGLGHHSASCLEKHGPGYSSGRDL